MPEAPKQFSPREKDLIFSGINMLVKSMYRQEKELRTTSRTAIADAVKLEIEDLEQLADKVKKTL